MQVPAHEIVAISSSTSSNSSDSGDNKPYDEGTHFDVVYDADKILGERFSPISAEHAAMCLLEVDTMCTHYLVKWAGYPTSHSTWTPANLCSKNLVDLYLQQKESLFLIPSREARAVRDTDNDDVPIVSAVQRNPLPVILAAALPAATLSIHDVESSSKRTKRSVCMEPDAAIFGAVVHTPQTIRALLADLNAECEVRIRGRDSTKRNGETVRLGCKHVKGLLPCSLQIYYDIKDGVISNIRRYSPGSCFVVCDVCTCTLKDEKLVYNGCHRYCHNCISHVVICGVRGEGAPKFVSTKEIPCGLCQAPLDHSVIAPLLSVDATRAYQDALCTIASIESEKITEIRLRSSLVPPPLKADPHNVMLEEITALILPCCPNCQKNIPEFDGCAALQCGNISGSWDKALGCGAHICAWCQKQFVDGHSTHQHVPQCVYNPSNDIYPPKPHPQTWHSVHRQVGRNRVWLKVRAAFIVIAVINTVYLLSLLRWYLLSLLRLCCCWLLLQLRYTR